MATLSNIFTLNFSAKGKGIIPNETKEFMQAAIAEFQLLQPTNKPLQRAISNDRINDFQTEIDRDWVKFACEEGLTQYWGKRAASILNSKMGCKFVSPKSGKPYVWAYRPWKNELVIGPRSTGNFWKSSKGGIKFVPK